MIHSDNRQRVRMAANGALIIMAGYDQMQLSGDMAAPFLQESNFWWLTGVSEPGWKAIFDTAHGTLTLVRPELSDTQRIFDGEIDDREMLNSSGADEIIEAKDFSRRLRQLARQHTLVHTVYQKRDMGFVANPAQKDMREVLLRTFVTVEDCTKMLARLRAIKQPEEIERMRRAAQVSSEAYQRVREQFADMSHEYEVEAAFTHYFRRQNAVHAYDPIVAAGMHACTLHYQRNDGAYTKNDLVLIDIGARVDGYASDITRTYCVDPSERQRAVHEAVRVAQERCIDLLKPDMLVEEYARSVDEYMKDALVSLDLLKDRNDDREYRKYFPHAVSHGLGVDTHDSLGAPRYFEPGMVLTVEPGIYITEEGIGVRIEDDILITSEGNENLTRSISTAL